MTEEEKETLKKLFTSDETYDLGKEIFFQVEHEMSSPEIRYLFVQAFLSCQKEDNWGDAHNMYKKYI